MTMQHLLVPNATVQRTTKAPVATASPGATGYVGTRRVLVLGPNERVCRPLARTLRLLCQVDSRAFGTGVASSAAPHVVVTIGAALHLEAEIRAMQDALRPFLLRSIPVLCLLDDPKSRDEVQARVIGASAVMAANAPSSAIAHVIRDLFRLPVQQRRAAEQASATASVQDVGFVLADLMNAAAGGMRIDDTTASRAGNLLLEALDADGISRWMATVGLIHDPTYRHCLLMAGIMAAFVLTLGFSPVDCHRLTRAAILHDIGKALVPVEIINKNGALTHEEMLTVRQHASFGHELLVVQGGHHPQILDVVRHHHEYLDGSGYPDRLKGDQIQDAVRISTICDVFAALVERRSYKPSMTATDAFTLLEQMHGKLDADLVRAFKRSFVPS